MLVFVPRIFEGLFLFAADFPTLRLALSAINRLSG